MALTCPKKFHLHGRIERQDNKINCVNLSKPDKGGRDIKQRETLGTGRCLYVCASVPAISVSCKWTCLSAFHVNLNTFSDPPRMTCVLLDPLLDNLSIPEDCQVDNQLVFLVPELCRMTGHTDKMRYILLLVISGLCFSLKLVWLDCFFVYRLFNCVASSFLLFIFVSILIAKARSFGLFLRLSDCVLMLFIAAKSNK